VSSSLLLLPLLFSPTVMRASPLSARFGQSAINSLPICEGNVIVNEHTKSPVRCRALPLTDWIVSAVLMQMSAEASAPAVAATPAAAASSSASSSSSSSDGKSAAAPPGGWYATAATRWLRAQSPPFTAYTEHRFEYVEKGGTGASSAALGLDERAVVKTLVFEHKKKPFIVLMHGDSKSVSCGCPSPP
jgi:hypothetical protein